MRLIAEFDQGNGQKIAIWEGSALSSKAPKTGLYETGYWTPSGVRVLLQTYSFDRAKDMFAELLGYWKYFELTGKDLNDLTP